MYSDRLPLVTHDKEVIIITQNTRDKQTHFKTFNVDLLYVSLTLKKNSSFHFGSSVFVYDEMRI